MTLTGVNLMAALVAENKRLRRERDEALRALEHHRVARTIVFKVAAWVRARPAHIHPRELARMITLGFWR